MSGVVSIHGGPVVRSVGRREDVVQKLRELLERAEAGDIVGLAACVTHNDETVAVSKVGVCQSYRMIGALAVMQASLIDLAKDT